MFEWLEQELAEIKSRKFHIVEREERGSIRPLPSEEAALVPPSYAAFISQFGAARLYRKGDYYQVGVVNPPVAEERAGQALLRIGHFEANEAYVKRAQPESGHESPVFELRESGLTRTADSFEQWLTQRCAQARKSYTKKQWQAIVKGPAPFSDEEAARVAARRHFAWRVLGVTPGGDLRVAVKNNADRELPFLTLGARATNGTMEGKIWLKTAGLQPGQEREIEHPAYKGVVARDTIELFDLPEPLPEDRDSYWEFQT